MGASLRLNVGKGNQTGLSGASGSAGAGSSSNPIGTTDAAGQIGQHMPVQAIPDLQSPDKQQLLNTFFRALDELNFEKMQKLLRECPLLVWTLNKEEPRTSPALTAFLKKIDDQENSQNLNYYKLAYTLIDYQLEFDRDELNIFSNKINVLCSTTPNPLYGGNSDFYDTICRIQQVLLLTR